MNKDKVKGELRPFSMLVMKCSDASPMLKYCAYHRERMMSIFVKVILELYVAISPFVLQILPHA
jgi:hypothetical protein